MLWGIFRVISATTNDFINPNSVIQLVHNVKGIDHREEVHAVLVFHDVFEEHTDNAHNLLLVVVIKHLSNMFDNVEVVVSEPLNTKVVVGQDPDGADHIVSNLVVPQALPSKVLANHIETTALLNEDPSQLIFLAELYEAGSLAFIPFKFSCNTFTFV